MQVIRLWQLPSNFFTLTSSQQWDAIESITYPATAYRYPNAGPRQRRTPCAISVQDDLLAVVFFLVTLGIPLAIAMSIVASIVLQSLQLLGLTLAVSAILAFHPLPRPPTSDMKGDWRRTRLSLALIRYFSMEVLIDRNDPLLKEVGTRAVQDSDVFFGKTNKAGNGTGKSDHGGISLPLVCLACPHGVFNYGAIIWCAISQWFVGWEQYTAAAPVIHHVPGLRYMNQLLWAEDAGRKSIQKVLRKRCEIDVKGKYDEKRKFGGVLGIVPDGILGAFRCKGGVDELAIGPRRGLMRLCMEEGATVLAAWFFGTTDMLTVVQDPFGLMEYASRKMQAGMMGFYGRWGLPVPRRIPVSLIVAPYKCTKVDNPSKEEVEKVHDAVYGGLRRVYGEQKVYAGYPDRTLHNIVMVPYVLLKICYHKLC